jgi:ABC-type antimicrobial peptide transport system permease subunit
MNLNGSVFWCFSISLRYTSRLAFATEALLPNQARVVARNQAGFSGRGDRFGRGFMLTRLMNSLLFGVNAIDPATFGAVPILLLAMALAACYLPACRATKVHPMVALRCE